MQFLTEHYLTETWIKKKYEANENCTCFLRKLIMYFWLWCLFKNSNKRSCNRTELNFLVAFMFSVVIHTVVVTTRTQSKLCYTTAFYNILSYYVLFCCVKQIKDSSILYCMLCMYHSILLLYYVFGRNTARFPLIPCIGVCTYLYAFFPRPAFAEEMNVIIITFII